MSTLSVGFAADVSGAKDPINLQRFTDAKIVAYEESQPQSYSMVLGELRRVDGVIRPEQQKRFLQPKNVERVTYELPRGGSSREVFEFYAEQLKALGAKTLFVCLQRACGSSNFWANRVFKIAFLYGPNKYQYYQVSEVVINGVTHYVAVYSIKRGNKRLYLHIEHVIPQPSNDVVDLNTFQYNQLLQAGFWQVKGLQFASDDVLSEDSLPIVETLAEKLTPLKDQKLFIVVHLSGKEEVTELLARSKIRAEQFKQALVAFGVESDILESYGVGPLAPASTNGLSEAIFFVLP